MITVVVGLITHEGKMLMQRRAPNGLRPDLWENPGGKVEPDDDGWKAALQRELREELKVETVVGQFVAHAMFRWEHTVNLFLFDVAVQSLPTAVIEWRWIHPLDALRFEPCSPATYVFWRDIYDFITANPKSQFNELAEGWT